MNELIKQLLKDYWKFEATDEQIDTIEDKEKFIKSYYLAEKFVKDLTKK